MSDPRICWDHAAIQYATQVDVGGLEVNDVYADAVFRAVHVSLPVRRMRDAASTSAKTSSATENDVFDAFAGELTTNEPLLLFVTGKKGTGKSHLVRWLKSRAGSPPNWHVVYVEKRNTSLRKVIERILDGINTPHAHQLRAQLDQASTEITSDAEAMDALLARVNHLVKFDPSLEVRGLPGITAIELVDLRKQTDRLLGDYTFRQVLCEENGPLARIVGLARGGAEPGASIDEVDLHLRESDFRVDPSAFGDTGTQFQELIATLRSNMGFRNDVAALCDYYLPRAKADIFTGQATDLVEVFQDVRREVARRGQELCLYIEDLVLLNGIDRQLAQALTVPADRELCRLRAAIAVTSGYLLSVDTFTDRGIHFTMDIDIESVGRAGIHDFVARYLNVGRLTREQLVDRDIHAPVLNACHRCQVVESCHGAFGTAPGHFGLFPFNGNAIDRLVSLASSDGFQPREVLREVIRLPLDTAETELRLKGHFPSAEFAKTLDEKRKGVPVSVRTAIGRENPDGFQQELTLRAFYAVTPPALDSSVKKVADFLSVRLTEGIEGVVEPEQRDPDPEPPTSPSDEVERWANGDVVLGSDSARKVRSYVCEAVVNCIRSGPYGMAIRKPRSGEWRIGGHTLRLADVEVAGSQGGGANRSDLRFVIERKDENAILVRGILAVGDRGGRLNIVDGGRWALVLNARIAAFADLLASRGALDLNASPEVVQVLSLLRQSGPEPGLTPVTALPALLRSSPSGDCSAALRDFITVTRGVRDEALQIVRDQATASKGKGKPSVLDVAQILPALKASMGLKDFTHIGGDIGSTPLIEAVAAKQAQASRALGAQVASVLEALALLLDPDEDLANALTPIGNLIKNANSHGLLPNADTLTRYEEVKMGLDESAISVYRDMATAYAEGMPSDSLWLGRKDVLPILNRLYQYVALVSLVMNNLEARAVASAVDHGETDAVRVISALRSLSDEFDAILKQGN